MNNHNIKDVSRETFEKALNLYGIHEKTFDHLITGWLWWNRSVNLFSRNTTADLLRSHILHSLLLLPESESAHYSTVLDAGTGGGLPGIPMAIADHSTEYLLLDKVLKKHIVLKDIIRKCALNNVRPLNKNLSDLHIEKEIRVVTKHAFHAGDLVRGLQHCNWSDISLLKGNDLFEELSDPDVSEYNISIERLHIPDFSFFQNKYILKIKRTVINEHS